TSMYGPIAGWLVQTCLLATEAGKLLMARHRKPVRAHFADQLIDQAALMLTLSGRVKETQQVLATQFSFRLRTPDLVIKVHGVSDITVEDKSSLAS
ncbi:hypothetical protein XENOCAPTIV_013181, partial [Xenoophorus captivus]